jgi:competence protein ComEA
MNANNRPVQLVTVALLALAGLIGGYRFWQHGQRAQSDLEIRGGAVVGGALQNSGGSARLNVNTPADPNLGTPGTSQPVAPKVEAPTELVVHVAGAVAKPTVYHLPLTARVEDAIKAAGGAKKNADLDSLNLAAHLEDGTQLFVPEKPKEDASAARTSSPAAHPGYGSQPSATGSAQAKSGHPAKADKLQSPKDGTVNLNTASAEQLQRLPGVGPSTATSILDHRKEIGKFDAIEQIQDVKGIGPKKFDKMKAFLRVR